MVTVFISHSAREDPDAQAVCDAVVAGLVEKKYDVFIDSQLVAGDEWEPRLYLLLASCHAAIVVLSPKALASIWVRREVNILLWRHALGVPMQIVPALIGGCLPEHVSELGYSELERLQFAKSAHTDSRSAVNDVVQQIISRFSQRPDFDDDSPMSTWINDVAYDISSVNDQAALLRAARALRPGDEENLKVGDPEYRSSYLAHQFLTTDRSSDAGYDAVTEIARRMPRDRLESLITLIAPTWVDGESARQLLPAKDQPSKVLLLSATEPSTAIQYLDRAFCCAIDGYEHVTVAFRDGEAPVDGFRNRCEEAIRTLLALPDGRNPAELAPERLTKILMARGRCFLIVDPDDYFGRLDLVAGAVEDVSTSYAWLTVILLIGRVSVAEDKWGLTNPFELPPLTEDEEDDGHRVTVALKNLIRKTRPR